MTEISVHLQGSLSKADNVVLHVFLD